MQLLLAWNVYDGDWPSGKALGSGPRIGGSNPSSPAMKKAVDLYVSFSHGEIKKIAALYD